MVDTVLRRRAYRLFPNWTVFDPDKLEQTAKDISALTAKLTFFPFFFSLYILQKKNF